MRDRYRIDAHVAREASADVFQVRDLVVGRPAVLKLLRTGDLDARWFDREARVLARVEHANVGRLVDAGWHGRVPFVVLEPVDGSTLAERLERGPLEVSDARRVADDIASALAHIHARGLAHGDVTPSSIVLATDRRVMLADPGVARLVGGRGTVGARSTEGDPTQAQVGGAEHVGAGDIYALGLVLVAALSARPPVIDGDDDATVLIDAVGRTDDLPPQVPEEWRPLLRSMLDPDPAARPDAGAVMAKLGRHSTTGPEGTSAETQVLSAEAVLGRDGRTRGRRAEMPPDVDGRRDGLLRQPVMWALVAIATLAALAAVVMGRELSDGASSDPSSQAAVQDGTATTTAPPATTPEPTTTVPAATTAPTTVATTPPTCADIDARKDWLDDQKQQLDDLYPDDKDLREEVKGQIEDEKRALEDYRRSLDC